jgi:membrane-associated phospholipid phosphatase
MGLPEILLLLIVFGIGIVGTAFWIWMMIDCATKEPSEGNDRLVWIIIVVFTHFIGAAIYFLVRRPQRIAQLGK